MDGIDETLWQFVEKSPKDGKTGSREEMLPKDSKYNDSKMPDGDGE